MKYIEQLQTPQWLNKRKSILEKDDFRCQNCYNESLFEQFRISFVGAGLTINKLLFVVYDSNTQKKYRCKTEFDKSFMTELLKISITNSIIALSNGHSDFCKLISTIILLDKIDYSKTTFEKITDDKERDRQKQLIQEKYLKELSKEKIKSLKWIDTKGLHIHHKYYKVTHLAWEYADSALITLC